MEKRWTSLNDDGTYGELASEKKPGEQAALFVVIGVEGGLLSPQGACAAPLMLYGWWGKRILSPRMQSRNQASIFGKREGEKKKEEKRKRKDRDGLSKNERHCRAPTRKQKIWACVCLFVRCELNERRSKGGAKATLPCPRV
jgi:hypothetical protein